MPVLKLGSFHRVKRCKGLSSVNVWQAGVSSIQNKRKTVHLNINSDFLLELSSAPSKLITKFLQTADWEEPLYRYVTAALSYAFLKQSV